MRALLTTVGFALISAFLSCSDKEEPVIKNSGSFTVNGIDYKMDKAILLSSCAWDNGAGRYDLYLLLMPSSTMALNITCDGLDFEPTRPEWISMGITVTDPTALDVGVYTTTEDNHWPFFVRLHPGEGNFDYSSGWLVGQMDVSKNGSAYLIEFTFEFTENEVTKAVTGWYNGTLISS